MSSFKNTGLIFALLFTTILSLGTVIPTFADEVQPTAAPIEQFTATDIHLLFEQDTQPMQLEVLSQEEMKETEGAWWYVAFPLAKAAIWIAPKLPKIFKFRVETSSNHTVLLQNNVHWVHIGIDKFGKHVGFGATAKNHARYHIYQNQPWRINPY